MGGEIEMKCVLCIGVHDTCVFVGGDIKAGMIYAKSTHEHYIVREEHQQRSVT